MINALPYQFGIAAKAKSSMPDAGRSRLNFVFKVILRFCTSSSKWFLYSFVPVNHVWNFSEPLARQNDANNRKGVVGSTGKTTPTAPIPIAANPRIIHRIRSGFFFI